MYLESESYVFGCVDDYFWVVYLVVDVKGFFIGILGFMNDV